MIRLISCDSEEFSKIKKGIRTFVVAADLGFHEGDYLGINEGTKDDKGRLKETGNCILVKILEVFKCHKYVDDFCVIMSICPCSITERGWEYTLEEETWSV